MSASRYLRHEQISGFSQQRCRQLHVLVIGAGAIGNEVIKNLALLGVGHLTVYDFDRVEVHNLTRSVLLREQDIGLNKAEAVVQHAASLDPSVAFTAVAGDIHDTLPLSAVHAADIVIGCTDNFEARIRINQLCWLTGTPWINTAIDARYGTVELFPFDNAGSTPACYECTLPASVYKKISDRQSCGGLMRAALAEQVMPTTTITTSITAGFACNEVLVHCGADTRRPGVGADSQSAKEAASTRIFIDCLSASATRVTVPPADLCPACGLLPRRATVAGRVSSANALLSVPGVRPDSELSLGDGLIWRCYCQHCGPRAATSRFEGSRAASVTDAITRCARCGDTAVTVEVRDVFTAEELAARLGAQAVPGAWALAECGLIELEQSGNPH